MMTFKGHTLIYQVKRKKAEQIIRGMFEVIKNFKGDPKSLSYILANLDGILEDRRSRIKHFVNVINDFKEPLNLIAILTSFLHTSNDDKSKLQKECASHILALLIEECEYDKFQKPADEFLYWMMNQNDINNLSISITGYTFNLLTILKTN